MFKYTNFYCQHDFSAHVNKVRSTIHIIYADPMQFQIQECRLGSGSTSYIPQASKKRAAKWCVKPEPGTKLSFPQVFWGLESSLSNARRVRKRELY